MIIHLIVFGISVASLPFICPELLEASPSLKSTHKYVGTTASQSVQLWMDVPFEAPHCCSAYYMKYIEFDLAHPIYLSTIKSDWKTWVKILNI